MFTFVKRYVKNTPLSGPGYNFGWNPLKKVKNIVTDPIGAVKDVVDFSMDTSVDIVGFVFDPGKGGRLESLGGDIQDQAIIDANTLSQLLGAQGDAARRAYNLQADALLQNARAIEAAAAQARALAEKNALNILSEGREVVRRKKLEHKSLEGATRARMWASGTVANTGSQQKFQDTLIKTNKGERNWITQTFAQQADVAREGGVVEQSRLNAAAAGAGAGAAALRMQGILAQHTAAAQGAQAIASASLEGRELQNQGLSTRFEGGNSVFEDFVDIVSFGIL